MDAVNSEALQPLRREDVIAAVERKNPQRVPMVLCRLWGQGLVEAYGDRLKELDRYPDDAVLAFIDSVPVSEMNLPWLAQPDDAKARDIGNGALPSWACLDEFIERLPDPEAPGLLGTCLPIAEYARAGDRYLMFGWWRLFFERPWDLRGMANLMMDYYDHPEEVHRLHDALCEHYCTLIRRAGRELTPDGFWTSDDLGNQRQLMMKPEHFREFIKPYYRRVSAACRECGMHFWLHSCGNNTEILDDLIEAGLDVFHPVQKHTMDEQDVARRFGERLTFLAGFDVQHTLQEGSPADVRREVHHLIDTFDRPGGGMCMAAGNGIVAGTPFENIEAFLDETVSYGLAHRRRVGQG